jgi:divalent metal cation (Fe/Co/Zn/Cd) transporter
LGNSIGIIAVTSDAWHHGSDAVTSAFASVGISIGLLGGPGSEAADDWAALCAAPLILYNACKADIAPDPSLEAQVRSVAGSVAGGIGLDKCFVRKMGLSFYVNLHITQWRMENYQYVKGTASHTELRMNFPGLCPRFPKLLFTLSPKKN